MGQNILQFCKHFPNTLVVTDVIFLSDYYFITMVQIKLRPTLKGELPWFTVSASLSSTLHVYKIKSESLQLVIKIKTLNM
jgi:hypothetical protein